MSAQQKPEQTAVAKREAPKTVDLSSAKTKKAFLDAYTTGKLDALNTEQKTNFLFALGERIGVRAELGELMIYQGKPYVTIAGYRRIAHETGLLSGIEARPATPMERRNYGADDGEHLWVCDVFRKGAGRAFRGWGCVTKNDRNPVTKTHPREMAKKRAIYDALRLAFPPSEVISDLHLSYAHEAEEAAKQIAFSGKNVPSVEYDETTLDALEGEEVFADEAVPVARPTAEGELPLGDGRPSTLRMD